MTMERCPRCKGRGTIVKNGPHDDEYDSAFPCPRCTTNRTALGGSGWVPVASEYPYPVDMLRLQQHADGTAGEPS